MFVLVQMFLVAKDENAQYYLVNPAESEWISRLKNWKRTEEQRSLHERTANLWAELDASLNRPMMEVPERQPVETRYQMTEPIIEGEPVRGLW